MKLLKYSYSGLFFITLALLSWSLFNYGFYVLILTIIGLLFLTQDIYSYLIKKYGRKKVNRVYIIVLILIVLGLILMPIIEVYKQGFKNEERDYVLYEMKIGENIDYVTLKEIKNSSVIINYNKNSVECGPINQDFELTKDVLIIQQSKMALEEIKENSAVIRFMASGGWC